jgi:hypothetical protein
MSGDVNDSPFNKRKPILRPCLFRKHKPKGKMTVNLRAQQLITIMLQAGMVLADPVLYQKILEI